MAELWGYGSPKDTRKKRERRYARLAETVRKIRKTEEEMLESDKLFISYTWEAIVPSFALVLLHTRAYSMNFEMLDINDVK